MHTILIIDDEPEISDLFRRAFERENFSVITAYEGDEGLRMAFDIKPNVILLDIMLPKIDGIGVFKKILSNPDTRSIPVGLYSALGQNISEYLGKDAYLLDKAFAYWEKDKILPNTIVDEVKKKIYTKN